MFYNSRYALRIVALNISGDIAVIYAEKGNYYKLPGGGIDKDEDHHSAAQREVEEKRGRPFPYEALAAELLPKNFATTSIRSPTVLDLDFKILGSVAKCSWKAPILVIQQNYNGKLLLQWK
ncbi:hypothetical protein ACHAPV_000336 [Trichoderma viride]